MPDWKHEVRERVAESKLEPNREAEIVEELAQHLDDRCAELRAGGATEDEARRAALVELDQSDVLAKELWQVERHVNREPVVLGSNRSNMIGDLWLDLRYGIRVLSKNPSFAAVAIITLALGIGVNSSIFSLVNAVLLRPLVAEKPEQLVRVYTGSSHTSFPNYRDLSDENLVFSSMAAHTLSAFNMDNTGRDESRVRVFGEMVTGSYFPTLGVRAAIGRTFETEVDDESGAHPVAVVSHGLWKRRFGADQDLVGRTIALNGHPLTVVGIMPEGFRGTFGFGIAPEVWVPVTMRAQLLPGVEWFADRGNQWLEVFGRLRPEFSNQQAHAAISLMTRRLAEIYPDQNRGMERTELYPMSGIAAFRGLSFAPAIFVFLGMLMVIVGLVLLIACANVANLLLARAVMRQKEVAIRLALGAGRRRLIRQFLTETLLLALAGGAAGCLLAIWITQALRSIRPPLPVPLELDLTLDARVLGYTMAVSLLSGVAFGLVPAWNALKTDVVPLLKDDGGAGARRSSRSGLRNLIVVGQVAVSLVLLICAGLFIRSLQQAHTVDPGFESERVLTVPLDLASVGYDNVRGRLFHKQLLDQVEAVPGVESASLAEIIPLTLSRKSYEVAIEGSEAEDGHYPSLDNNTVGPRYFQTMGIPVKAGREFTANDDETSPRVVIINETMAHRFWPGQSPLGRRVRFPQRDNSFSPYYEIVGVVRDTKYGTLGEEPRSFFYLASPQYYSLQTVLHVRTAGDPDLVRSAVRDRVLAINKDLLVEVATMRENLAVAFLPARVGAALLGLFGLLGLSLALVGIYGVISYAVSQRSSEIGLRMALGAQRGDILRLVVGHGLKLTLAGIGIGVAVSLVLTRFLSSLLVGVSPVDPLTFITLMLLFSLVSLSACYIPARRATKVDPMVALRHE